MARIDLGNYTYFVEPTSAEELHSLRETVEVLESLASEPMTTIFGVPAREWV